MQMSSMMFRKASLLACLFGCSCIVFHPEWRALVAATYGPVEPVDIPKDTEPTETLKQQEEAIENRLDELRNSNEMDLPKWGLFATATYGDSERESRREIGFDGNLYGVTLGTDYRIDSNLVLGAAASTFKEKADLLENAGKTDIRSHSISFYSGYTPTENSHIDVLAGYTRSTYDGTRNAPGIAIGSVYDGFSIQAALNAGYNFYNGPFTFGPLVEVSYARVSNDDKVEKEGGAQALTVEGKKNSSLSTKLGATVSQAMSFEWGVLSPFAAVFYQHEFLDDAVELMVTNNSSGVTNFFLTDDPDRNTFIGRIGMAASMANNINFFASYEQLYGHDYLQKRNVNVGARLEF